MISRLDRYIAKSVVASYVATLLFVLSLFIIFDLLINMSRYMRLLNDSDMGILDILGTWAAFHLVSLPWIFVAVAPFVTVIGCMFAVSRFMASNEITPMLFTGRSIVRVVAPCMAMAAISGGAMGAVWETVLPATSRDMTKLETTLRGQERADFTNIALFSRNRKERLMVSRFVPELQRMEGIVVVGFDDEGGVYEIRARAANWHPEQEDWELQEGMTQNGRLRDPRAWLGVDGVSPEMLWLSSRDAKTSSLLSYTELLALMRMSPQRHDLVIALHYHLTWPLSNIVLLLLALPFAVRFERGGRTGRVVLAVTICAAYLVLDLTCQNLGRGEFLHPILASWTPTIVFGSLGLVMFGGMRT